jgi:membrane associated rhomboid family serine protease
MQRKCFRIYVCLSTFEDAWISSAQAGKELVPQVNPMIGPWPDVLVNDGAKDAAMIMYRDQWWRLLTPMLLHVGRPLFRTFPHHSLHLRNAGVVHILVNVLVQLRVGVYLEYTWGRFTWSTIYVRGWIHEELRVKSL